MVVLVLVIATAIIVTIQCRKKRYRQSLQSNLKDNGKPDDHGKLNQTSEDFVSHETMEEHNSAISNFI